MCICSTTILQDRALSGPLILMTGLRLSLMINACQTVRMADADVFHDRPYVSPCLSSFIEPSDKFRPEVYF